MKRLKNIIKGIIPLMILGAILFTSCDSSELVSDQPDLPSTEQFAASDLNISVEANTQASVNLSDQTNESLLKQLRQATARFHSTQQATRAGYEVTSPCVVAIDPTLGAMGYHWANQSLIDPIFEISKPEALLYEQDKNGNLKLVGAEYIVINNGQDQPHFGDRPFDIGGTPIPAPHWSLHVWLWKDNPNGIFTNYNPNVTCPD